MRNVLFGISQTSRVNMSVPGMIASLCLAAAVTVQAAPPDRFQQVNLVSDLSGQALLQDTNLVNSWGMAFSPTSPFWISDNGTGKATLYAVTNDADGVHVAKQGLEVTIPGEGNPTGQVFNNVGGFNGDLFLFDSEDGTISGWRAALGTNAETLATREGAVYKGLTLASTTNGPVLLAANFSEGTIDVYNTNSALVAQYSDPLAPEDYAPFNVQTLDGMVFVTFAKQDEKKEDDVSGAGHGLIDVFNPDTGTFHRFATGTDAGGDLREMDSPWGLTLAPSTFGQHAGQLLVGNFGSGTIMTFDATGDFEGLLRATRGGAVSIDGLWALSFGNGGRGGSPDTLYFTAGPDDESHGLFGQLDLVSKGKSQSLIPSSRNKPE